MERSESWERETYPKSHCG